MWYAVMRDRDDTDWGYGSENLDEAISMAKEMGNESYIAVIDNDVCVKEISQEDFDNIDELYQNWWVETDYIAGDFHEKKWALHRDNEIVLWGFYSELEEGLDDIDPRSDEYIEITWSRIEQRIETELGFLPDYSVN